MKKITLLFILLTASLGFAQQQQYNLGFEPSTPSGVLGSWTTFENLSPGYEIVTNPDPDGVNTSSTTKVLKINMVKGADCYAGAVNYHGTLGTWKLDSAVPSNLTLSMQVNKSVVGKVGIKFANATDGTVFEIKDDQGLVTTVNEWVTLTWNISGFNPGDNVNIDQMVVFIDWRCTGETARPSDVQLLVDNITWGANKLTDAPAAATCSDGIQNGGETGVDCGGTCSACIIAEPLVAAPTPPARNAADVVSIYSNAYTNVTLDELPTSWSQLGAFTATTIAGNNTWKITSCEFLGMVTNYGSGVDLSTMEKMHIDYWTPDTNGISVKIVNTVNGGEAIASLGTTVTGSWRSIDVDMTAFAALPNKTKITQLLIDPSAPSTLYIDNFYFYKGTSLGTTKFDKSNVKMYPNPVKKSLTIEANSTIEKISVYNILGQEVLTTNPKSNSATLQTNNLQKGVYIVKTEIDGKVSASKIIKE